MDDRTSALILCMNGHQSAGCVCKSPIKPPALQLNALYWYAICKMASLWVTLNVVYKSPGWGGNGRKMNGKHEERERGAGWERCFLWMYMCIASHWFPKVFSSAAHVHLDFTWMRAFLSNNKISSSLRFNAAVGFRGNCNCPSHCHPDHYCFPTTAEFKRWALIYCRDDNKVLCCNGIPYQCQLVLKEWSNGESERLDSKAAINGRKTWYVTLFNILKMVHKP